MKILAFNGSARKNGNSSILLNEFIRGANEVDIQVEKIFTDKLDLKFCKGCLRCNLLKSCSIRNDDWQELSHKILKADKIIFATPVYFHHVPASIKKIIDRFRSFVHVQILEHGLKHTPWVKWQKHFILIMSLGSPLYGDTKPITDLFEFFCDQFGSKNKLTTIIGNRLAVTNQILMDKKQLTGLYKKLKIPIRLVEQDFERNQQLLKQCYQLGKSLV